MSISKDNSLMDLAQLVELLQDEEGTPPPPPSFEDADAFEEQFFNRDEPPTEPGQEDPLDGRHLELSTTSTQPNQSGLTVLEPNYAKDEEEEEEEIEPTQVINQKKEEEEPVTKITGTTSALFDLVLKTASKFLDPVTVTDSDRAEEIRKERKHQVYFYNRSDPKRRHLFLYYEKNGLSKEWVAVVTVSLISAIDKRKRPGITAELVINDDNEYLPLFYYKENLETKTKKSARKKNMLTSRAIPPSEQHKWEFVTYKNSSGIVLKRGTRSRKHPKEIQNLDLMYGFHLFDWDSLASDTVLDFFLIGEEHKRRGLFRQNLEKFQAKMKELQFAGLPTPGTVLTDELIELKYSIMDYPGKNKIDLSDQGTFIGDPHFIHVLETLRPRKMEELFAQDDEKKLTDQANAVVLFLNRYIAQVASPNKLEYVLKWKRPLVSMMGSTDRRYETVIYHYDEKNIKSLFKEYEFELEDKKTTDLEDLYGSDKGKPKAPQSRTRRYNWFNLWQCSKLKTKLCGFIFDPYPIDREERPEFKILMDEEEQEQDWEEEQQACYEKVLNTFTGYKYTLEQIREASETEHGKECIAIFEELVRDVFCRGEEEVFTAVMRWLGFKLRYPYKKTKVMLVITSQKGVGKGFFITILEKIFHTHYFYRGSRPLGQSFNEELSNRLMVAFDEMEKNMASFEGEIKHLITEGALPVNGKFKAMRTEQNIMEIIMLTNADIKIPVSSDERRILALKARIMSMKELGKHKEAFKNNYDKVLNDKVYADAGVQAIFYHLLRYPMPDDYHPWNAVPQTDYLLTMMQNYLNPVHDWWKYVIERGGLDTRDNQYCWDATPGDISWQELFSRFKTDRNFKEEYGHKNDDTRLAHFKSHFEIVASFRESTKPGCLCLGAYEKQIKKWESHYSNIPLVLKTDVRKKIVPDADPLDYEYHFDQYTEVERQNAYTQMKNFLVKEGYQVQEHLSFRYRSKADPQDPQHLVTLKGPEMSPSKRALIDSILTLSDAEAESATVTIESARKRQRISE